MVYTFSFTFLTMSIQKQTIKKTHILTLVNGALRNVNSVPNSNSGMILNLQLLMLVFVRSIREGNFSLYIDSLTQLVKWFFALDPEEFLNGNFVVH